ncbi:heme NO-binding domain-containing protein [Haloferula sargassicola]|uniref:heme NO-binding domain-containing protein n=1 Tax=Haloferula sargassicola TaxID=490096 RepID=UPI0033658EA3
MNKAIRDRLIERHGEEAWYRIRDRAGIEQDVFLFNEGYPDEITYALVAATSAELDLPADEVLRDFGEFWALDIAHGPFGALVTACGSTLGDFLRHLPAMHTRTAMIFPDLDPPRFECDVLAEGSARLHYHTPRTGLTHFIIGLVHGMAKYFQTACEVTVVERKDAGADHDVFEVSWAPSA